MKNTRERVLAVKKRVKEIEVERRIWKRQVIEASFLAASLSIILGLSLLMPSIRAKRLSEPYNKYLTSASIFDGNNFAGYILIGLLAFILGVSLTLLSYHIRIKNKLDKESLEDKDD